MKNAHAIYFFCALTLFVACEQSGETDSGGVRVRTLIESTGTADAEISVIVEGPDGNAVSGAVVLVRDSANTISILPFDYETCSYTDTREVLPDGVFVVCVKSALLESDYERSITHV